jgi:hypothetical protein
MKKTLQIILISVSTLFLSCDEEGWIGPCVHTYKEPILHITSIRDSSTNEFINFVKLRNLEINGSKQFGSFLLQKSYSIVAGDSLFYCNVPFGFGIDNGTYEFTLEAEGYPPKRVKIEDVGYSILEGGCPSYNDGGKRVELFIN